jgi:hypothetical protein
MDRWEKWAPVTGIAFVVLFLLLFFLPVDEPPQNPTAEELTAFFEEEGRARPIREFFLAGLGAASLMWFSGSLRAHLRRVEGAPGRLSAVAFGSGMGAAVLLFVAGSLFLAPASTVVFAEEADRVLLDPSASQVAESAGFIAFTYALFAAAVMITASSLLAVRSGALPVWFGWVGFVVALALVFNVLYFFGFLVFLLWILVASIILMMRSGEGAEAGLAPPGM